MNVAERERGWNITFRTCDRTGFSPFLKQFENELSVIYSNIWTDSTGIINEYLLEPMFFLMSPNARSNSTSALLPIHLVLSVPGSPDILPESRQGEKLCIYHCTLTDIMFFCDTYYNQPLRPSMTHETSLSQLLRVASCDGTEQTTFDAESDYYTQTPFSHQHTISNLVPHFLLWLHSYRMFC